MQDNKINDNSRPAVMPEVADPVFTDFLQRWAQEALLFDAGWMAMSLDHVLAGFLDSDYSTPQRDRTVGYYTIRRCKKLLKVIEALDGGCKEALQKVIDKELPPIES